MTLPTRKHAVLAVALAALLCTPGVAPGASRAPKVGPTTCFWGGPATDRQNNFAYPDAGAAYWAAEYTLPAGATLLLRGQFPHARYMSLNAYTEQGTPSDSLPDRFMRADAGSTNPFIAGARRDAAARGYTVNLVAQAPPANRSQRQPNTLYSSGGGARQVIILRIYVWDNGQDVTGGVGLPAPVLRLADGRVLRDAALCAALGTGGLPEDSSITRRQYAKLRNQRGKPKTFPSLNPPRWDAAYNSKYGVACVWKGRCGGKPKREVGQYANLDNAYVSTYANRGFGKVLVIRGKLPTTPRTIDADPVMGSGQLRYWSLCQNEGLSTTSVTDCLFDEQLTLDSKGYFTIVTSKGRDRPSNARTSCGVNWLPWPKRGDGAGHKSDGYLILRNMLPARSFKQAIQRTKKPGDEKRVMGAHYPRSAYTSKRKFQKRGCKAPPAQP